MSTMTRRSLIGRSAGLIAAASLSRPYIANADAKTATVWWVQGFAHEEDISFEKIVADYEKASGNKIDHSIIPYAPLRQKIVAAITSGDVPDVFTNTPTEMLALHAWNDRLTDVSDVVATQAQELTETARQFSNCYNSVDKKRSYYGVPFNCAILINHIWKPLVEKAGHKIEDVPKTWDAFYDFFKGMQKPLRGAGMRSVHGLGLTLSTVGNDSNNQFNYFLIANGGRDLVTKEGKLNLDAKVRDAAIKALIYETTAYKEGYVPSGAVNWNDSDNNNALHSKQIVMDLDGTISSEIAIIANQQDYHDLYTLGIVNDNDGHPMPAQVTCNCGMVPKGAKNPEVAKDFLKYFIQPKVMADYAKVSLCRNLPVIKSVLKDDPWWFADQHRKAYIESGLLGETSPEWFTFNPAYAEVRNEHVWGVAWADIIQRGMAPKDAAEKAFKRVEEIFAKYPIAGA